MPCWEAFAEQDPAYRDEVLPPAITARVAIEAGVSFGWERWVGDRGTVIGVDRYGASAPGGELMKHYGLHRDNVVAAARALL